ncbi:MAG: CGNR zinc finger domain-containing protein [Inquilinaceae bacterium]
MGYAGHHPIRLIAGRLALDFLNTADWSKEGAVLHENLTSPADLDFWATAAGLRDADRPDDIEDAIAYRAALRSLFVSSTHGARERSAMPIGRFPARGMVLDGSARPPEKSQFLDIVATSALALLSDRREMVRIKLCPGDRCGWLFLDETRNARRKWCMMKTCGNRAKAARHYAKVKPGRQGRK